MVEARVLPRIETLWGKAADINEDGRLAILVSPTINDEKTAIGFFNPSDFFKRNMDRTSASYNPASNEMDIIYIAAPDDTAGTSYSIESIIATVAHELTHAVTFTHKTWKRLMSGETTATREALFLDEGWSHLSENLCGYGISGGNIEFLQRFFDDTATYSFCGTNRYGQEDSAGSRGAITLFLSWLFWEKGGMTWDSANSVKLTDRGGITFLQTMIASSETGWDSIGTAYDNVPTNTLFEKMLFEINALRISGAAYQYRTDSLTGEPVDFFVNMGNISDTLHIGFPKTYSVNLKNLVGSEISAGTWSLMLFEPFTLDTESIVCITAKDYSGTAYYVYNSF
jgi:hypothetical protein